MKVTQAVRAENTVVDTVWAALNDDQWHTINDLTKCTHCSRGSLLSVVGFLLKYGFAEWSLRGRQKLRLIANCPPPKDIAGSLWVVVESTL